MNTELREKSIDMHNRAYDMFPLHHQPSKDEKEPFAMYSYERAASIFWSGFIDELYIRGLNCAQIEWLLRSKQMRWMFDYNEGKLEFLAKAFVTNEMVEAAIKESK